MLALDVVMRDQKEPAEQLRSRGFVPAVLYGRKERSASIAVDARKLEHVWKEAGQTSVVTLKGAGEQKDALIHDVQLHPVTGNLLHADFYVLEKGQKVKIKVPLEFTGQSPAEKAGNIVVKSLHELEIEVAPSELPHRLRVDVSALKSVGERITAFHIALPPSAVLITHGEEIVASVSEFKEEKIEATAPTLEVAEVAEKEKAPAEGEAAAAPAPASPEAKDKKGK